MSKIVKLTDAGSQPPAVELPAGRDGDYKPPYRDQDIVLHEQPETAVYPNGNNCVCIRQRVDDPCRSEPDHWIVIDPAHVETVIAAIRRVAQLIADFHEHPENFEAEVARPAPRPTRTRQDKRRQIEAALRENPARSDRQIARELNVSDKTVTAVRRRNGGAEIPDGGAEIPCPPCGNSAPDSALSPTLFANEETEATPA
jgi:hypothetical protein